MGLSLEIKKFINAEHTGEYATIYFPLPEEAAAQARQHAPRPAAPRAAQGQPEKKRAPLFGRKKSTAAPVPVQAGDPYSADFYVPAGDDDIPDMPAGVNPAMQQPAYTQPVYAQPVYAQPAAAQPPEFAAQSPEFAAQPPEYAAAAQPDYAAGAEPIRIHYIEEGDGEPVLLIHTVGQSCYTWRNVFYRLREHYRVIAIDLPGHGYSDRPEFFGYTVRDYALALRLFMDAIGLESAHMLAFSMGAAYALQLALEAPERVGRLLFISPGGLTPEMPTPIRMMDSPLFGPLASALYGMGTVRKLLESCFFDLTNISDEVVQEYYRPASDKEGRRAIRYALQAFDDEPLRARLREVQHPTLIIQGSEDKWHSAAELETFHAAMHTAGFAVVRNAGHLMHEEKADRLTAAMLEFIPVMMPAE